MSAENLSSIALFRHDVNALPVLSTTEEQTLMARAPYDRAARNRLLEGHLSSVIALGSRRSKGKLFPEEIRDLQQDIALAVTTAAARADSSYASFGELARATARGLARDYPKRNKTVRARQKETSLFTPITLGSEELLVDAVIDPLAEAPFDAIHEAQPQLPQLMRQAMQTLSQRQRAIVEMTFGFHGSEFTAEEIARALKISIKTVRGHFEKAMKVLRSPKVKDFLAKPLEILPDTIPQIPGGLTPNEDTVLRMFGHFGGTKQPIANIQEALGGISKARVYQLRNAGIARLEKASLS